MIMLSVEADKKKLRSQFIESLHKVSDEERSRGQELIVEKSQNLLSQHALNQAKIAAYRSFGKEVSIDALLLNRPSNLWSAPLVKQDQLEFYTEVNQWQENQWGIKEPVPSSSKKILLSDHAAVFVPGVAFDRMGRRLGRGKGFYDKSLQNYLGLKIGVCFAKQISNGNLPVLEHDILMDFIITENFILKPLFRKRK